MDEENIFYLQVYNAAQRSWVTITPYRYMWDVPTPPSAEFSDSCPATKALGALARNNPGQFRVSVDIDGVMHELIQVRGRGVAQAQTVRGSKRGTCCD